MVLPSSLEFHEVSFFFYLDAIGFLNKEWLKRQVLIKKWFKKPTHTPRGKF